MMISLPSQISQWPIISDFRQARLTSFCASWSRMLKILLSGGFLTTMFIQTYITWLWTISASPVHYLFIAIPSHVTNLPLIATSTAIERVFSWGCQLLSFTRNCLSASSIHAYLCLGSWGSHDLIFFEDIMSAVRGNSKRKWEDSWFRHWGGGVGNKSCMETIVYSLAITVGIFYANNPRVPKIPWVSYDTMAETVQYVPVPKMGAV
jgi:hypothetical protein